MIAFCRANNCPGVFKDLSKTSYKPLPVSVKVYDVCHYICFLVDVISNCILIIFLLSFCLGTLFVCLCEFTSSPVTDTCMSSYMSQFLYSIQTRTYLTHILNDILADCVLLFPTFIKTQVSLQRIGIASCDTFYFTKCNMCFPSFSPSELFLRLLCPECYSYILLFIFSP
jgi:hypothetical protein